MRCYPLRLLLLLLMLLNHAVLACDSVVLHGPSQHHSVSGLTSSHHHQITAEPAAGEKPAAADSHTTGDSAEPHGHVLCFVAYSGQFPLLTQVIPARPQAPPITTSAHYTPPVPPPNH